MFRPFSQISQFLPSAWFMLFAFAIAFVAASVLKPDVARAASDLDVTEQSWSYSGPLGRFDRAQLQRGFKVYQEVCSACHGIELLQFRSLGEPGGPYFSKDEVKALAATFLVKGLDDFGDEIEVPATPSHVIPSPFANEVAAAANNGGSVPPDLSVIAKGRSYARGWKILADVFTLRTEVLGSDYIHGFLTGYREEPPVGVEIADGQYYSDGFPGGVNVMPPPLSDDLVDYPEGVDRTVDQYARDVTAFLAWAADPRMEERKRLGLKVVVFLIFFSFVMILAYKSVARRQRRIEADQS